MEFLVVAEHFKVGLYQNEKNAVSDISLQDELASIVSDLRHHLLWQLEEGPSEILVSREQAQAAAKVALAAQPVMAQEARPGALGGPTLREKVMAAVAAPSAPQGPPTARAAVTAPTAPEVLRKPLDEIRRELGNCTRCKLCQGRKNIVFGSGNPRAELVFVGEGPGAEEDAQGVPFVGAAGQLLTKMIEAMGYSRDSVYICNVVKCRPPNNRNPEPDEIAACEPFLKAQLSSIQPKAIVALGKFAAQTLLRTDMPITSLRGIWKKYEGIPMMPTFHPAYLLRQPAEKKKVWADLQEVMKMFGKLPPKS